MLRCLSFFWGVLFSFILTPVCGQDASNIDCHDFASMHAEAFMRHLQRNETQLMKGVVEQWEQECGMSEPVFRAKVLVMLMQGNFPGDLPAETLLDNALAFKRRNDLIVSEDNVLIGEIYSNSAVEFGYIIPGSHFDSITKTKANEMLVRYFTPDISYAYLTLYSGNTAQYFNVLKKDHLVETPLGREYRLRVKKIQNFPLYDFGISSGIWVPQGNLEIIGVKPLIGIYAGLRFNNTIINGLFDLRFGRSSQGVEIDVRDSLVVTRNQQGGYLGLGVKQILLNHSNLGIGILLSGGYDIIEIVEELRFPQKQTFGSPAFTGGIFIEVVFANRTRLSVQPGYTYLNHNNTKGSPLDGNAWVLRFNFGLADNAARTRSLSSLGY